MRIGVLTNPRSRRNQRRPGEAAALQAVLGDRGEVVAPPDLDALDGALRTLREASITVLGVHGGDGTLHRVLTAAVRAYGDSPLPPIALLRGGTMNNVAVSIGSRLAPIAALQRLLDASRLPERTVRSLRVTRDDHAAQYGFLAGNGLVARFLEVYYASGDPSPATAAKLLAHGTLSAVVGGTMVQQLTRPWEGLLRLDGEEWPHTRWTAVAVSTIEQMGLGFRVFHLLGDRVDRLQVVGLAGSAPDIARDLPSLYRGRGVHRPAHRSALGSALVLKGDAPQELTIDGDVYVAQEGRVAIDLGPAVRFLRL